MGGGGCSPLPLPIERKSNTMSGFFRAEADDWLDSVEVLVASGKPWPRGAVRMDLRWWADQVRVGKAARIPGAIVLMQRWCWTHWATRTAMANEAWWSDPYRTVAAQAPHDDRTVAARSGMDKPDELDNSRTVPARSPHDDRTVAATRVVKTPITDTDTDTEQDQREEQSCPTSKLEPSTPSASAVPAAAGAQPSSESAPSTPVSTSRSRKRRLSSSDPKFPTCPEEQAIWTAWTTHLGGGEPLTVAITSMRALLSAGRKPEELIEVAVWSGRSSHSTAAFNRERGNHRGATPWRPANFERYLDLARQGRARDWRDVGAGPMRQVADSGVKVASPCPTWDALPDDVRSGIAEIVMDEQLGNVDLDVDAELERRAVEYNSKVIQLKVKERA